jgi:hypothetical protein
MFQQQGFGPKTSTTLAAEADLTEGQFLLTE